jgi:hypothetical protein
MTLHLDGLPFVTAHIVPFQRPSLIVDAFEKRKIIQGIGTQHIIVLEILKSKNQSASLVAFPGDGLKLYTHSQVFQVEIFD